jgi:hypothetical protein
VRQREGDTRSAKSSSTFGGAAKETQSGSSARFPKDLDFEPVYSVADSRSEGFSARLFGGESRGKAFSGPAFAQAICLFGGGEDPVEETFAESIDGLLNARDFDHIDAGADDHPVSKLNHVVQLFESTSAAVVSCTVMPVALPDNGQDRRAGSDKVSVIPFQATGGPSSKGSGSPWIMQIAAVSGEEPGRLVRTLTGGIVGCGGWILSRGMSDSGRVSMLFEFERHACLDIYTVLIGAGIELNQSGHSRFTELCQCTRLGAEERCCEIASVDLEIIPCVPGTSKGMLSSA